jgi:hypothetical protein
MKYQIQPQRFTAVADAAHQFHRVERMENARISRNDKTDGGVLYAFGQPLGCGVWPKLHFPYDLLYSTGNFLIDRGDFVKDTRDGSNGYICPSGDISYTYFLFNHVIDQPDG